VYKDNQVTLKDAINKLLDTYQLKGKMKTVELVTKWEKLVGSMTAKHTLDIFLHGSTLTLKFDSAPLKQEVSMMKTRLMKHLNDELGEEIIKEIRIL